MKRIHIFCEGQTEEEFSRELLYDHFFRQNININPIVVRTSERGAAEIAGFESPEHINDDPWTAPSKRILKHYPKYQKVDRKSVV